MTELVLTRGLPGSGKSTWARSWVLEDPATRAEVNRDRLREMAHGGWTGRAEQENQVTVMQYAAIRALLKAGISVVCSDTNLQPGVVRKLHKIADRGRVPVRVVTFTNVPLETCIERDAGRSDKKPVGEAVIRQLHGRHLADPPDNRARCNVRQGV